MKLRAISTGLLIMSLGILNSPDAQATRAKNTPDMRRYDLAGFRLGATVDESLKALPALEKAEYCPAGTIGPMLPGDGDRVFEEGPLSQVIYAAETPAGTYCLTFFFGADSLAGSQPTLRLADVSIKLVEGEDALAQLVTKFGAPTHSENDHSQTTAEWCYNPHPKNGRCYYDGNDVVLSYDCYCSSGFGSRLTFRDHAFLDRVEKARRKALQPPAAPRPVL